MIRFALAILLCLLPVVASAEEVEMNFYLRNHRPHAVVVELYSQSRRHVWPGDGKVYLLEKGERKAVPIECEAPERICWGAWINGDAGTFWGVGPDNGFVCEECCTLCIPKGSGFAEVGK
jgi:hypothetical protein